MKEVDVWVVLKRKEREVGGVLKCYLYLYVVKSMVFDLLVKNGCWVDDSVVINKILKINLNGKDGVGRNCKFVVLCSMEYVVKVIFSYKL